MAAAAPIVDTHKQLAEAARALALALFSPRMNFGGGEPATAIACDFCLTPQAPDDYSHHAPACKVGAVLARLAELEDAAAGRRGQVVAWPATGERMDYGEPWHVDSGEPAHVHDRDCLDVYVAEASEVHERDEQLYARRVAACVNLCAGMKTAALIHAFDVMTATTARWGLVAVPLDMDDDRQAELARAIDRVIGGPA